MAPRGRPKKRNTRMDAAVDAMTRTYGFSEETVRRVVKELLKEYEGDEGDEGWFFIEQYSYQELVDAILRDQDQNDQSHPLPNHKEDAFPENAPLADAGPSDILKEPTCYKVAENELETNNREDEDHLQPPTEKDGKDWKDIGLDQSSNQKGGRDEGACHKDVISNSNEDRANRVLPPPLTPATTLSQNAPIQPETGPVLSQLPRISSPPLPRPRAETFTSRRLRPCYGWIDSDEEEEAVDFIQLTPAIHWEGLDFRTHKKEKRRSRWDLRPQDN